MTQNVWFIAAIWMALALSASLISIWAGISVALIEILVGVVAGNFLGIHATTDWINFLALLGSGVLTFLAGAEIDPLSLKSEPARQCAYRSAVIRNSVCRGVAVCPVRF